jgi:phosphopantetheine adenylyltransferase
MSLIAPSLQIDTPALQDVYGPTAWDPNVHACVVSQESIKGAQASAFVSTFTVSLADVRVSRSRRGARA